MSSRLALVWPLLLAVSCAPHPAPPIQVMGLALDAQGSYEVTRLELKTLEDPVAFQGSVATLMGGARIVVDPNDPMLSVNDGQLTDEQLAKAFLKSPGMPPRGNYVEHDGVLWPADFHTWNMVTTYFNFETSFSYFEGLYADRPAEELLGATVYYFPTLTLTELGPEPQLDNALFFSPVQAFAILPFEQLQKTPLSINLGVVGHEYAHRVFNRRVYRGEALPSPFLRWQGIGGATPAINLLKALDEGLADYHAFGVTCLTARGCDPRFLGSSFSDAIADERDISEEGLCMTAGLRNSLETLPWGDFTRQGLEYRVGSLIAAALYQAGERTHQRAALQRAVLSAYSDSPSPTPDLEELIYENLQTPHQFHLAAVANTLAAHIPDPELRSAACSELIDRLQIACSGSPCPELPACPATTTPGSACPKIN